VRLSVAQVRGFDRWAIETLGLPGLVLMENAARGVAEFIGREIAARGATKVVILCGPGNNGGDGFAAARLLLNNGVVATCILAGGREKLTADAATNLHVAERLHIPVVDAAGTEAAALLSTADVIVDALLGTGASGPPRGVLAELVRAANAVPRALRVAVDVPTGLDADSGVLHDPCFRADATVTFVAEKTGFATSGAQEVLGRVVVVDIGVPLAAYP
jgi:NAD(P)H-hydrate epimerase